MIVEQDLEVGIKLADWLAAHGYQAVLVRSVESAIDECMESRPQAVLIELDRLQPANSNHLRRLLLMIEATRPGISVITMGYRASGNMIQVMTSGGVRHVLVQPIDTEHIGRLLQAELNRATGSPASFTKESGVLDGWAVKNLSHEAETWVG